MPKTTYRITVPQTIGQETNESMQFSYVMTETPGLFLSDVRWGKDLVTLRHSDTLVRSLKKLKPGDWWDINEDDYRLLVDCVTQPSVSLNPVFARKLLPYFDAILEALKLPETSH